MARTRGARALVLFMNGERVGNWSVLQGGRHELRYDSEWLESSEARPISLSMPLAPFGFAYRGAIVESYFDNLLPDNAEIRTRIKQRFGCASLSPFDLLTEVGRDCVGALQLLPEGEESGSVRRIDAKPLREAEVGAILGRVTTSSLGRVELDDAFRISIAGAQEKTALLRHEAHWCEPLGATPTTHILKLPLGRIGTMGVDLRLSLENEWLSSRISRALGLEVAHCQIERFGDVKALVVERFDRRLAPNKKWIMRLPQEDLCQATGTPSALKYQSDGGPGIASILGILLGAQEPFADRAAFLRTQLVYWLLAAPDGHAKNFSLFMLPGGRYHLTPMYDIMSAYPVMGHGASSIAPEKLRMAMSVSGKNPHYRWRQISLRHWRETASVCGMAGEVDAMVRDLITLVPEALADATKGLPPDFPDAVVSPIVEGVRAAAERLEREIESKE